MAKILILANSGFGKSFSIGKVKELGHKGLNPKETYLISVTSKGLTFPNGNIDYTITTPDKLREGNRIITSDPFVIANTLEKLAKSPYKNIIIDDFNYIIQDYYMENSLKGGWDTPKKIGAFTSGIFVQLEKFEGYGKNIIIMAHPEIIQAQDGRLKYKLKTVGKMVDEYITPEGKFDVTLIGHSYFDSSEKKVVKHYVTQEDEFYSSAKCPFGMLPPYIPNDLGLLIEYVDSYYKGRESIEKITEEQQNE